MIKSKFRLIIVVISILFFQQCCTTQNGIKKNKEMNDQYSKPIPRGMIDISSTVIEVFSKNGNQYCLASIDTVYSYGAGIRPIAEGTAYEFLIDKNLFDSSKDCFVIGNQIKGRLQSSINGMNMNNKINLKLISLSKKEED